MAIRRPRVPQYVRCDLGTALPPLLGHPSQLLDLFKQPLWMTLWQASMIYNLRYETQSQNPSNITPPLSKAYRVVDTQHCLYPPHGQHSVSRQFPGVFH